MTTHEYEDTPPAPPHPAWARKTRGRPSKFVTEDLRTFCPRCNQWKHLSEFYMKTGSGPRYSEEIGGTVYWYGSPGTYCVTCHGEVQKEHRMAAKRPTGISQWDNLQKAPTGLRRDEKLRTNIRLSENYPTTNHIRGVLVQEYDMSDADANKFTADQLYELWDTIKADRSDTDG